MTKKQLQIRQLEIRSKLGELAGGEWTDEQKAEADTLRAELVTVEERLAAAIAAEPDDAADAGDGDQGESLTAEERERRQLRDRSSVGEIVAAALGGQRLAAGPTFDYLQASGINTEGQIPVELLVGDPDARAAELQAAASVGIPAAGLPTRAQPTVRSAFPTAMGDFTRVVRRMVGVGQHSVPTISAPVEGPSAAATEGDTVADTTVTIGATALTPGRLQVSAAWSVEDAAVLPSLEDDVRMVLRDAIADAIDRQALTALFGIDSTAADATTETWATYLSTFYDRVDGRFADSLAQVRAIVGQTTYGTLGATYRDTGVNDSVLSWAMRETGGVRVSAHAPAAASGAQAALFVLGGQPRNAHQLIWPSVGIIRDAITQASEGEVKATLVALAAVEVNRAGGYHVENWDLS